MLLATGWGVLCPSRCISFFSVLFLSSCFQFQLSFHFIHLTFSPLNFPEISLFFFHPISIAWTSISLFISPLQTSYPCMTRSSTSPVSEYPFPYSRMTEWVWQPGCSPKLASLWGELVWECDHLSSKIVGMKVISYRFNQVFLKVDFSHYFPKCSRCNTTEEDACFEWWTLLRHGFQLILNLCLKILIFIFELFHLLTSSPHLTFVSKPLLTLLLLPSFLPCFSPRKVE